MLKEWISAIRKAFKETFTSKSFLVYAVLVFLLILPGYFSIFWDFDNGTFLQGRPLGAALWQFWESGDFSREWSLALLFYAFILGVPQKVRVWCLTLVLFPIFLYSSCEFCMLMHYSCKLSDMTMIVKSTHAKEIVEFISVMFHDNWGSTICIALTFLAVPAGIFFFFYRQKNWGSLRYLLPVTTFLALLLHVVPPMPGWRIWEEISFVRYLGRLSQEDFYMKNAGTAVAFPQLPAGTENVLRGKPNVIGMFVLGESDNRAMHSLYGYDKQTDRRLSEFSGNPAFFRFTDVVSATSSTMHSIYFIFTDALVAERKTKPRFALTEWFQTAGIKVCWLSNQRSMGFWSCMPTILFQNADVHSFMADHYGVQYDRKILSVPVFKELEQAAQRQSSSPTLVCVHLLGSHYQQKFRVDPDWKAQHQEEVANLNEYELSIAYTDHFLYEMVRKVQAMKEPAFFLYLPDHSEMPNSFRSVKAPDPVYYEIPTFLYCNEAYRKAFPEIVSALPAAVTRPYQTDRALYLLARLMGFPADAVPAEHDILSSAYVTPVRWIRMGEAPYPDDHAKTEKRR